MYRNAKCSKELFKAPENIRNIHDVWRATVAANGSLKCMEDYTYQQVDQMTQYIGSWLADGGFKLIYIHSINRVEWMLVDIACTKFGIITVPLYDTLGEEALNHTIGLTGGKLMVESRQAVEALLKANPESLKNITHMILLDELTAPTIKDIAARGIKMFKFREILDKKLVRPYPKLDRNDHWTYCFTSGTTGVPKGVIATHENLVSEYYSA